MNHQPTLFSGAARLVYDDAIDMTLQSMQAYGPAHDHWAIAFSGGKDSSATMTLIMHLIEVGRLQAPKTLTVFYADTRLELPPLAMSAERLIAQMRSKGVRCEVVTAPLDKRFMVYILGRGVPPPNNNTLRWCTRQIKVDPMTDAIAKRLEELDGNVLMITGVRQGESAIRDGRIEMSCGKDGAECGQGWYQQVLPQAKGIRGRIATLAPLLHWRVCNVWDWLKIYAPMPEYGGWETRTVADAYGGDEAEEINARTGCTGCPLASQDTALDTVVAMPRWSHLAPLKGLKPLWREIRKPEHRLKKVGLERLKDGSIAANPQRMGPLTFAARLMALDRVLQIQSDCNSEAARRGLAGINILDIEEEARIRELIAAETWPQGWDGDEPTADTPMDTVFADGSVQPLFL
ncbi:phosphoadenosine phosphosulfate reductase family protein [Rhizobium sp. VS19-DR104.2]|uniref:phosphoadenosine phosphosulfate reductase domain-containing protein n=1 Tax=unclassified Rhizobium TaxID=2613769 RepID=UPI001CC52BE2|nr:MULTISPECIES: phosphoadenosine phosphosulfate reductase family protein [unclassified Rhizobium]MBZ5761558.1 phosphoadenosine phosphosulfate reductase family protein [Rhizobium sp. VS19-DR96]MBZ5767506.1 phosphoadenosine phosphosulfate reductase family protein [Rhizobium sp. VS19-DR129.2]MBZ5775045.1 phosphoadenosine phosphosulfate reductase family protein [Rhizobium sp. VS19-DRK62.2]MBZ5785990.1 phosphoadenosine phosphosulfate reductase family protein [Rhizobium sp. VS19-DR121]MBZ5803416.1 